MKRVLGCGLYSSGSGYEPVTGSCEHGNETSNTIPEVFTTMKFQVSGKTW